MGRWDDGGSNNYGYGSSGSGENDNHKKRNLYKLIRRIIFIGFVVVGSVILYVYFMTAGLNAEVIQRGGPVETISVNK